MTDTIVPRVAVETRPASAKGTGSLRLKVPGSPLAAVEAALDGGIGVRCAKRPTTFDGRQLSRIKLMSRPASGPAQPQGGTTSEPIVSRDATKSASRKVNELREQPTARQRLPAEYAHVGIRGEDSTFVPDRPVMRADSACWGLLLVVLGDGRFFTLQAGGKHV